jgi:hypothetical protein
LPITWHSSRNCQPTISPLQSLVRARFAGDLPDFNEFNDSPSALHLGPLLLLPTDKGKPWHFDKVGEIGAVRVSHQKQRHGIHQLGEHEHLDVPHSNAKPLRMAAKQDSASTTQATTTAGGPMSLCRVLPPLLADRIFLEDTALFAISDQCPVVTKICSANDRNQR